MSGEWTTVGVDVLGARCIIIIMKYGFLYCG